MDIDTLQQDLFTFEQDLLLVNLENTIQKVAKKGQKSKINTDPEYVKTKDGNKTIYNVLGQKIEVYDANEIKIYMSRCYLDISINSQPVGRIDIGLFETTPRTGKNFKELCKGTKKLWSVEQSFHFKDVPFHRIIPGFMAQSGDFISKDGKNNFSIYGPSFKDENFIHNHDKGGLISMANSGKDTNGSQFFITFDALPHLDGKNVVFGEVCKGMNVLDEIQRVGSENGKPSAIVMITESGEYPLTEEFLVPDQFKIIES